MPSYNELYLAVLRAERLNLLDNYYKPQTEGTGIFNTAASVLQMRIEELEKEIQNA
jgi:hypothetical protein